MDQLNCKSDSRHATTNNILVFNLQPPPHPGGESVAGLSSRSRPISEFSLSGYRPPQNSTHSYIAMPNCWTESSGDIFTNIPVSCSSGFRLHSFQMASQDNEFGPREISSHSHSSENKSDGILESSCKEHRLEDCRACHLDHFHPDKLAKQTFRNKQCTSSSGDLLCHFPVKDVVMPNQIDKMTKQTPTEHKINYNIPSLPLNMPAVAMNRHSASMSNSVLSQSSKYMPGGNFPCNQLQSALEHKSHSHDGKVLLGNIPSHQLQPRLQIVQQQVPAYEQLFVTSLQPTDNFNVQPVKTVQPDSIIIMEPSAFHKCQVFTEPNSITNMQETNLTKMTITNFVGVEHESDQIKAEQKNALPEHSANLYKFVENIHSNSGSIVGSVKCNDTDLSFKCGNDTNDMCTETASSEIYCQKQSISSLSSSVQHISSNSDKCSQPVLSNSSVDDDDIIYIGTEVCLKTTTKYENVRKTGKTHCSAGEDEASGIGELNGGKYGNSVKLAADGVIETEIPDMVQGVVIQHKKLEQASTIASSEFSHFETNSKIPSEQCFSDLKILQTMSLANVVPSFQAECWQQLSAKGFYCCGGSDGQCGFISQIQTQFESHLRLMHPADRNYPCVHCGSLEGSGDDLLFHLDRHLGFDHFSIYCTEPTCNFHACNPDNVLSHMSINHPYLNVYVCWCCSSVFGSLQQFIVHIRQNSLQIVICPYCDAKDTDRQQMLSHISSEHIGQGRMIQFRKLLLCRERTLFGWKIAETASENAAGEASKIGGVITVTELTENLEGGGKEGKKKVHQVTSLISDGTVSQNSSESRDRDLIVDWNSVESTGTSQSHTNSRNMKKQKVSFSSNKDDQIEEIRPTELNKLVLEPVDHEISAENSEEDFNDEENVSSVSVERTKCKNNFFSVFNPLKKNCRRNCGPNVTLAKRSVRLASREKSSSAQLLAQQRVASEKRHKKTKRRKRQKTSTKGITKTFTCTLCFLSIRSKSIYPVKIYKHMYMNHSELLQCPLCMKKTNKSTTFFKHLTTFHPENAKDIYQQRKVANWISSSLKTTPDNIRMDSQKRVLTEQMDQDFTLKNRFEVSGHAKNRKFFCVFCNFSFRKANHTSAYIYQNLYKHVFLMHSPHLFQCPDCQFCNCIRDTVENHIKEKHEKDEEPRKFLLPKSPKSRLNCFKMFSNFDDMQKDSSHSAFSSHVRFPNISLQTEQGKGCFTEQESPSTAFNQHSIQTSRTALSENELPLQGKKPPVDNKSKRPGSVVQNTNLSCQRLPRQTSAKSEDRTILQIKPRDFYSMEWTSGNEQQLFRCLQCSYSRVIKNSYDSSAARTAIIRHVQKTHLKSD